MVRSFLHSLVRRPSVRLALLLAVLAGAGCQSSPSVYEYRRLDETPLATDASGVIDAPKLGRTAYQQLKRELRPGDVVIAGKSAPSAALIRLSMSEYGFYTHSGIIDIRNGRVVVSHVTGRFHFFNDSPRLLGKLVGSIEAIDLDEFMEEYDEIKFVRLPDTGKNERLSNLVRACEDAEIPFDGFFDLGDPATVHCSEYTLRVLGHVGYDFDFTVVDRTPNQSLSDFLAKLGITSEHFIRVDGFAELPGTETIAIVSRFANRELSLTVADAIGLLHDLTVTDPDLRVAEIVSCDADRLLHYAPATESFLRAAVGMAIAEPTRDLDEIHRRNEMLYEIIGRRTTLATESSESD